MKKIYLFSMLSFCAISFAQIEKEIIEINEKTDEVPFVIIEKVPVYKGCNENLESLELRKCMSDAISKYVANNFNIYVAKDLGLPDGKVRINVIFKVNKKGNIINVKTKAPHPKLQKEAARVVNLIPKFTKPGYHKGKPVIVSYALPIVFQIDNSKYLSKKEKRKLKKNSKDQ